VTYDNIYSDYENKELLFCLTDSDVEILLSRMRENIPNKRFEKRKKNQYQSKIVFSKYAAYVRINVIIFL